MLSYQSLVVLGMAAFYIYSSNGKDFAMPPETFEDVQSFAGC